MKKITDADRINAMAKLLIECLQPIVACDGEWFICDDDGSETKHRSLRAAIDFFIREQKKGKAKR